MSRMSWQTSVRLTPASRAALPARLELGLAEVDAGHLVAQAPELDRVASEAAGRVEHAGAGFEPHDAGDPLHLGGGVYRGSERM